MRTWLRCCLSAFGTLLVLTSIGQDSAPALPHRPQRVDPRHLLEETTKVAGQGNEVPGYDLAALGAPRHGFGPDSAFAERLYVDTLWRDLNTSEDSVVPGVGTHWVRYHFVADAGLKDVPLVLHVQARTGFEVFLNGRSLFRTAPMPWSTTAIGLPRADSVPIMSIPLTFAGDGRPEVLALRLDGAPGRPLGEAALRASLHPVNSTYAMQRLMLHHGVFIGINAIILLLALVIWSLERSERSWLLLALLSLVTAVETLCELGGSMGMLGVPDSLGVTMRFIETILMPWPIYLLILVLGTMQGELSRRHIRLNTIAVMLATVVLIALSIMVRTGIADTTSGLIFSFESTGSIIAVILFGVLFAAVLVWFSFDVVRLGIRLLRTTGYARWIGAGALASSLLTIALKLGSGLAGVGLSAWLSVLSDYCANVAVPVSVAVYLAIRSAHHNRLVARQRDELDLEVKERTAELSAEKERSDELLLNILPAEVAEELKRTGEAVARHFDQASVLFTDFKGFTSMTEQVSAGELLQELNTCFKAFDDIIGTHGIEKIKTIGDAYMCAGGLPDPGTSSPSGVVHAALAMQDFMKRRKAERDAAGLPAFEMRVGIHTGPVVAGIVGVKKFQYDIWGDTVNTASRMESSGETGQVNISESTYLLVRNEPGLSFTPRGKVQAKGKGEMEMYFVHRTRSGSGSSVS